MVGVAVEAAERRGQARLVLCLPPSSSGKSLPTAHKDMRTARARKEEAGASPRLRLLFSICTEHMAALQSNF